MSDPKKKFLCFKCKYMISDVDRPNGRDSDCRNCLRIKRELSMELDNTSIFTRFSILQILNKFEDLCYYNALNKMQNIIEYASMHNVYLETAYQQLEGKNND